MQISHSHYLGGPAAWTDADRALAEAYVEWKNGFCPDCGTREEMWDPKQGGHRHAMVAETHRCPGCELKEQLRSQLPSDSKGVHVRLVPNPELVGG
jgi:hypothetical protein